MTWRDFSFRPYHSGAIAAVTQAGATAAAGLLMDSDAGSGAAVLASLAAAGVGMERSGDISKSPAAAAAAAASRAAHRATRSAVTSRDQVGAYTRPLFSSHAQFFFTEAPTIVHFSAQPEPFELHISPNLGHKKCSRQTEQWTGVADKKCARQAESWTSVRPWFQTPAPEPCGVMAATVAMLQLLDMRGGGGVAAREATALVKEAVAAALGLLGVQGLDAEAEAAGALAAILAACTAAGVTPPAALPRSAHITLVRNGHASTLAATLGDHAAISISAALAEGRAVQVTTIKTRVESAYDFSA